MVQLNGNNLNVKSWNPYAITCDVPRDTSGIVKVTVNDGAQFSNEVPLTLWHATATYTVEEVGSLTLRMTFDLTFRGDVHEVRLASGAEPVSPGLGAINSLSSRGTYELSGSWTDATGRNTIQWSGAGILKPDQPPGTSSDGTLSAALSIVDEKWNMAVNAFVSGGQHVRQITRDAMGNVISDQTVDNNVAGVRRIDPVGEAFQGTAPKNFDVTAGMRSALVDSQFGGGNKAKITVEWSFGVADPPTDMTTASWESPPKRQAAARGHGPSGPTSRG